MAITIDVKALVNDAVKNLDVVNDRIDAQDRAVNKLAKAQHDLEASALKLADAQKSLSKNTDPSKQHDLEGAVLSARVALDKQQAEVEQLARDYKKLDTAAVETKGSFGNLVTGLADVKAGFDIVTQAAGYLKSAFDETVAKAIEWGDSMGDLAQLTGQSVEETSRLAATMELVGVDATSLGRIVKSMTKQGLDLNLATLLKLNKQYNELQSPVERNAFLFRNFGKSAEDMAEIMGRSEEELRRLVDSANKGGKVITDEAAAEMEAMKTQMKVFQEQMSGLEIKSGMSIAQSLRPFVYWMRQISPGMMEMNRNGAWQAQGIVDAMDYATRRTKAAGEEIINTGIQATDAWTRRWRGVADEALAAKAMYDTQKAASDLKAELIVLDAGLSGDLSRAQQEFYDNQKDVAKVITETKDKIAELESKKYLTDEQKTQLDELKTKLAEQQDVLEANRQKWTETTNSIIFDMIRQAYAADGQLSQPEIASLTELGLALGRYDQKTADVMTSVQNAIVTSGTISREELQRILDKYGYFNSLPNIEKTVTMKYQKIGDENFGGWTPPATPSGGGSSEDDGTQLTGVAGGYASGGSFVVPGSGSGDRPYVVNLTPGERVDVTPVGKSSGGGGGSPIVGQIVIQQQPGQDAEDLARVVQRHIAKWARQKAGTGNW